MLPKLNHVHRWNMSLLDRTRLALVNRKACPVRATHQFSVSFCIGMQGQARARISPQFHRAHRDDR